jgi:hypothetical protein
MARPTRKNEAFNMSMSSFRKRAGSRPGGIASSYGVDERARKAEREYMV